MKLDLMPEKLMKRLEKYDAAMPPFAAMWDRVFVYPLAGKKDTLIDKGVASSAHTTASGLYLPGEAQETYDAQMGFIVSMGPKAWEQLRGVGVGLGDIVVTNRLSRWQKRYWADRDEHIVIIVTAGEITGCVDLLDVLSKGEAWYELDDKEQVVFNDGEGPRPAEAAPAIDHGV